MPNFDTTNKLSLDVLRSLASDLPPLNLDIEQDFSEEPLCRYLDFYGFNKMACWGHSHYSLSALQLEKYKIAMHCWSVQDAEATVCVFHGLFDHVGLYLDLIDTLVTEGFAVVAIDLPGHGLSEGERAVISDFSEYAAVIEQTLVALEGRLGEAIFAVGQSTGGAALLNYILARRGKKIQKLVLLAPLVKPSAWPLVASLHTLLYRFFNFVPRQFKINSHDQVFNDFLEKYDPLQDRFISVEWVGAMKQWIRNFNSYEPSDIATRVFQGNADTTVSWKQNLPMIQSRLTNCQIEMIDGAMHHLVNEGDVWRKPIFDGILNFLQS